MLVAQLLVMLAVVGIVLVQFNPTYADVYMHNPRGSNDRNCERNVNRNNGNRLFDSQNNNNGGYACQRGVGDETFQDEAGQASFRITIGADDDGAVGVSTITQNKRIYYYSGSILPIEFTDQHGCGSNSKVSCEIVMQYACEDTLDPITNDFWPWVTDKAEVGTAFRGKQHFRSGSHIAAPRDGVPRDSDDAATDTIPDNVVNAIPDTKEDRRFGMQESFDYYQLCQRTERNKGLYTADQLLRRNDRRATRQNPNGNRNGFECPEERDYYPWWAPSPWVDVAVLTDSGGDSICTINNVNKCTKRCQYYMNNTMNFIRGRKGYCDVDHTNAKVSTKTASTPWQTNQWYNNEADCVKFGFKWYEISHEDIYDGLKAVSNTFVCAHTQYSRVNQLGNAANDEIYSASQNPTAKGNVQSTVVGAVQANRFLWTIPKTPTVKAAKLEKLVAGGDDTFPFNSGSDASAFMAKSYQSCVFRIRYNISSSDFPAWPDDAIDSTTLPNMVTKANNSKTFDDPNTPLTQDPYIYIGPGDCECTPSTNAGGVTTCTPPEGKCRRVQEKFVSLAVNTNQYARTFQDRSYVFSIKPLPASGGPGAANTRTISDERMYDKMWIDVAAMNANLAAGGKIYNVNVRGKRGNIVQTFPSVEYDFVPNALALSKNDMIHFQWTGSDYNPRRGCNDGEGGPPDLNTYNTNANANLNSRADRSNIVFTEHMANNVPRPYKTYTNSSSPWVEKEADLIKEVSAFAPCYNSSGTAASKQHCIDQMMWLAYLNQEKDGKSLSLRNNEKCLTQAELDAILNQDVANNHPLNCAKMNAKPYPYFDGGLMMMRKSGWFPFFSSRNNNFSNRQQGGILCIAGKDNGVTTVCTLQNGTGVLQDQNPEVNGRSVPISPSSCDNSASGEKGATGNGAMSCLNAANTAILTVETATATNGDNDNKGDGNRMGCPIYTEKFFASLFAPGPKTVEQQVALAIILLFVGIVTTWLSYFLYNRWQARSVSAKMRGDKSWQQNVDNDMKRTQRAEQQQNAYREVEIPAKTGSGRFTPVSTGQPSRGSSGSSPTRVSGNSARSPPSSRSNSSSRKNNTGDHV